MAGRRRWTGRCCGTANEFLWVSERSNWAQIYLYDLTTGKLKNQVTHGDGPVFDLPYVDAKKRVLYFTATGKVPGVASLLPADVSGGLRWQEPDAADAGAGVSHGDGMRRMQASFVDTYSTVEKPQTTVLRDAEGKVLVELGQAGYLCSCWLPGGSLRRLFTVKARDGKTDAVWAYMQKPTTLRCEGEEEVSGGG